MSFTCQKVSPLGLPSLHEHEFCHTHVCASDGSLLWGIKISDIVGFCSASTGRRLTFAQNHLRRNGPLHLALTPAPSANPIQSTCLPRHLPWRPSEPSFSRDFCPSYSS